MYTILITLAQDVKKMLSHASETFSPFYVSWSAFKGQQKHHLMAKGGGGAGVGVRCL